jgi:hypothetical protein
MPRIQRRILRVNTHRRAFLEILLAAGVRNMPESADDMAGRLTRLGAEFKAAGRQAAMSQRTRLSAFSQRHSWGYFPRCQSRREPISQRGWPQLGTTCPKFKPGISTAGG